MKDLETQDSKTRKPEMQGSGMQNSWKQDLAEWLKEDKQVEDFKKIIIISMLGLFMFLLMHFGLISSN